MCQFQLNDAHCLSVNQKVMSKKIITVSLVTIVLARERTLSRQPKCFQIFVDFQVHKSDADLNQLSCSKHISDAVQLNWSLLGTEINGTASLRGITLSSAMLSLITVAPLKWGKLQFEFHFRHVDLLESIVKTSKC